MIEPGLTICVRCRTRDAVAIFDPGERWAEAVCFDCIEDWLERVRAAAVNEAGAVLVAVAGDELELGEADPAARRLLERLSSSGAEQARRRCWAILPDGSRCRRRATAGPDGSPFLCETHRHGCRVPGLGWRDGVPSGRVLEAVA